MHDASTAELLLLRARAALAEAGCPGLGDLLWLDEDDGKLLFAYGLAAQDVAVLRKAPVLARASLHRPLWMVMVRVVVTALTVTAHGSLRCPRYGFQAVLGNPG